MTRETKVGLMMVVLLVGVFGFLLYKRVHKPLEALATPESTNLQAEGRDNLAERRDTIRQQKSDESLTFDTPRTRRSVPSSKPKTRPDDEFSSNVMDNEPEFTQPVARRPRLNPPKAAIAEVDDFAQFDDQLTSPKMQPPALSPEPSDDAFDQMVASKQKNPRVVVQVAASSDSDPFSNDASGPDDQGSARANSDGPSRTLALPATIGEESNENSFDSNSVDRAVPLNIKDSQKRERSATQGNEFGRTDAKTNRASRPALVQQASDFDNGLEPAPREERRAAPVTFEERSFSPEGQPSNFAASSSYVIEPSDNFWTISRKRYGVGRYYMALARHNEQVVPDPKRMKPGVAISTPDVAVLEQRYSDLIPKPAPADPAPAVTMTQSRKPEETGPSGFFVSAEGSPMYRITGQDTLSDIAKSHLGRSSRWVQILEMNRNVLRDGNELKIGTVLKLPADASRVQVVGTPRQFR